MTATTKHRRIAAILAAGVLAALAIRTAGSPEPDSTDTATPDRPEASVSPSSTSTTTETTTDPPTTRVYPADSLPRVPTSLATGEDTEELRRRLDEVVHRFVDAWTLQAPVEERRATLEPLVAPGMADGLAMTYLDELPTGELYGRPLYDPSTLADDFAVATVVFTDDGDPGVDSVVIELSRFEGGLWRVMNLYPAE